MLPLGLGAAASFGCPGADEIALHIGKPTQNRERQAPGAGAGVGPRLRQGSELRLGVYDTLDDAEQVEGAAGEAVDARHRHHVTGGEAAEQAEKFAPVGPRARGLLAVDVPATASGGAELLKLAVERLTAGADAGIADEPFFEMSCGHTLR